MAISRYHLPNCIAGANLVPGDCRGPDGPRNDSGGRYPVAPIASAREGSAAVNPAFG